MSVTMQQVLAEIDREEPNYPAFAEYGPEALPYLKMIIATDDPLKAAKAAYAASLIGGSDAFAYEFRCQAKAVQSQPQRRPASSPTAGPGTAAPVFTLTWTRNTCKNPARPSAGSPAA